MATGMAFADYAFGAMPDTNIDKELEEKEQVHFRDSDVYPIVRRVMAKYFPEAASIPRLEELERNATAILSMGHPFLMNGMRSLPHNFVFIGK